MKISKKTSMLLSFAVGATMFATSATAEIVNKSGYEQMKDVLKNTAKMCSDGLNSYKIEYSTVFKHNGKVLSSDKNVTKYDHINKAAETYTLNEDAVRMTTYKYYNYSDSKMNISNNGSEDIYSVDEFTGENPIQVNNFQNPFENSSAEDVEKIGDAFIGNLKEYILLNQNLDGTKSFSGSLSEIQIPALLNALASLQCKNIFSGQQGYGNITPIVKDIYIKDISGQMEVNKEGLLERVLGTGVLSGMDVDGNVHEFSIDVLVKLSDINVTVVQKPDLTGKIVQKNISGHSNAITNPEKFIGKYKRDMIVEKDNKFIKVGESFIEVLSFNTTSVAGKCYDVIKPEFEGYVVNKKDFIFNSTLDIPGQGSANIRYKDKNGNNVTGNLYMDPIFPRINLNIDGNIVNVLMDAGPGYNSAITNDSTYNLVFE